jgi:chromosome segregation ATPase
MLHLLDSGHTAAPPPPPSTGAMGLSMPPPAPVMNQAMAPPASWPPAPAARPNTTLPFFAALGAQPQQVASPGGVPGMSSALPPTMQTAAAASAPMFAPAANPQTLARLEGLANELAHSTAEIATLRSRLQQAEQSAGDLGQRLVDGESARMRLDDEVRALRQALQQAHVAAATDVAEIEALDDTSGELDELRQQVQQLGGQLELMTHERNRLDTEVSTLRQGDQERALELEGVQRQLIEAHADVEQHRSAAEIAERALADLDGQLRLSTDEVAGLRAEISLVRERALAIESERQQVLSELEQAHHSLGENAGVRAELDVLVAEKAEVERAWATEQQQVTTLEAKLAEIEAHHADTVGQLRTQVAELEAVAATVEALQTRLTDAERHAALEAARADRAVADAAGLRQMAEQLTHEQARIVGEMEQLRPIAAEVDRTRASLVDMQRQLEAALGTDERDGSTTESIDESVRARTRELLELARAIEPFTWGLQQATSFFADASVEGATRHLQAMTLLHKTLERLKNELDRLHAAA